VITCNNFERPLLLVISNSFVAKFLAYHSLGVIKEGLMTSYLLNFGRLTHELSVDIFKANHRWCGKVPLFILDDYELATFTFFSYGPVGDA